MLGSWSLHCVMGELYESLHILVLILLLVQCNKMYLWALAPEFMERECRRVMAWVRLEDVLHTQGFSAVTHVKRVN